METKHAWYLISKPSSTYAQIFREFEFSHELTYMLLSSCLQDHQVTASTFKKRIQAEYPPDVAQSFEESLRNDNMVSSECIEMGMRLIFCRCHLFCIS